MLHKQYCWKILDHRGRLVDPEPIGPNYLDEFVLGCSYDSAEDAIKDLEIYLRQVSSSDKFILQEYYELL